jgi:hypothetical protein
MEDHKRVNTKHMNYDIMIICSERRKFYEIGRINGVNAKQGVGNSCAIIKATSA